jgi:hypothetical protein
MQKRAVCTIFYIYVFIMYANVCDITLKINVRENQWAKNGQSRDIGKSRMDNPETLANLEWTIQRHWQI